MGEFGSPVAAGVQGPQAGLQTLSNLLSLKQQQIGIARQQIGLSQAQQQLSQETSQATVAGVNAQQTQALSQLNPKKWVRPDGSLDTNAATQDVMAVAPNLGPAYLERLQTMAQGGVATKKAYLSLNQELQSGLRSIFGTWAANPKDKPSDLAQQLQIWQDTLPKGLQAAGQQISNHVLSVLTGPNLVDGTPHSLQEQKAGALAYARAGLNPSEVGGAGGIASPTPATISTGGAIVPGAISPVASGTPGKFTPQGRPIPTTLPPQIIKQPITGGPAEVGGAQGTTPKPIEGATGGAASGPTPWWQGTWQPSPGQSQMVAGQVQSLQHRINAGEMAANTAPTAIDALDRARSILDAGTWTGGTFSAFKDLKNVAAGLGFDTKGAQNASELAKNLARYEASRAGSVGQTDAARSLYEAGAPNTKMDAAAVKAVVLQSLGIEKMIQGYAKVVGGAPDPHSALQAEQKFRSIPHLVQAYELGFMRNQKEADGFFSRYGVSGRELAKSAQELKALGAL
jgi:hypothetical protein